MRKTILLILIIVNYSLNQNVEQTKNFGCLTNFREGIQSYLFGELKLMKTDNNEFLVILQDVYQLKAQYEFHSKGYAFSIMRAIKDGYDVNADLFHLSNGISPISQTNKFYFLLTDFILQNFKKELFSHIRDPFNDYNHQIVRYKTKRETLKKFKKRKELLKEKKRLHPINSLSSNFKIYKKVMNKFIELQKQSLHALFHNNKLLSLLHSVSQNKKIEFISQIITKYIELNKTKIINDYFFTSKDPDDAGDLDKDLIDNENNNKIRAHLDSLLDMNKNISENMDLFNLVENDENTNLHHFEPMKEASINFYSILYDQGDYYNFDILYKLNTLFLSFKNKSKIIELIRDDNYNNEKDAEHKEDNIFNDNSLKCYYFDLIVVNNRVMGLKELIPFEYVKEIKKEEMMILNKNDENEEMMIMDKRKVMRAVLFDE